MTRGEISGVLDTAAVKVYGKVYCGLLNLTPNGRGFFLRLIRAAISTCKQEDFCESLEMKADTLISRFWRRGLPSVKKLLIEIRLVYVAALYEAGATTAEIVRTLHFPTSQIFCRHLKHYAGVTPGEYRRVVTLHQALGRFADLVTCNRARWTGFRPVGKGPA